MIEEDKQDFMVLMLLYLAGCVTLSLPFLIGSLLKYIGY